MPWEKQKGVLALLLLPFLLLAFLPSVLFFPSFPGSPLLGHMSAKDNCVSFTQSWSWGPQGGMWLWPASSQRTEEAWVGNPLLDVLEIQSVGNHPHKDADMLHFDKVTCTTVRRVPGRTHKTAWVGIACAQFSNFLGIFTKRSSGELNIRHQVKFHFQISNK